MYECEKGVCVCVSMRMAVVLCGMALLRLPCRSLALGGGGLGGGW